MGSGYLLEGRQRVGRAGRAQEGARALVIPGGAKRKQLWSAVPPTVFPGLPGDRFWPRITTAQNKASKLLLYLPTLGPLGRPLKRPNAVKRRTWDFQVKPIPPWYQSTRRPGRGIWRSKRHNRDKPKFLPSSPRPGKPPPPWTDNLERQVLLSLWLKVNIWKYHHDATIKGEFSKENFQKLIDCCVKLLCVNHTNDTLLVIRKPRTLSCCIRPTLLASLSMSWKTRAKTGLRIHPQANIISADIQYQP
ncbi:uncharacterized protein [Callorhinus ursinus]|uniref:uncharacterized protein n=1 Tax=Callorhinus ursinus TaxID=34884 RepID=UPI003CCFFAEE